jgi:FtsZ-binding cell division protein ZapB
MIIIRDNAVWWRRPDGAETQATPEQCAHEIDELRKIRDGCEKIMLGRKAEIERLQTWVLRLQNYNRAQDEQNERLRAENERLKEAIRALSGGEITPLTDKDVDGQSTEKGE